MPKKGHTEEQILQALRQAEGREKAAKISALIGAKHRGQSEFWPTQPYIISPSSDDLVLMNVA